MAQIKLPSGLPASVRTILQPDKNSAQLICTQMPMPVPTSADDVLVKVHATCPCAGELWWARDYPGTVPEDKLPVVGQEISGQVVAASDSSPFKPGDEVYGRLSASRPGGARDYTIAKASELARKPHTLNFLETAATPLSALTAWQGAFVHGTLDAAGLKGDEGARKRNAGLRVLVTGASGGVGSWVVQLCALAGAGGIVAVCGPGKEEAVRKLGATEVINYKETSIADWATSAEPVDLVIDCVGGQEGLAGCWRAVKAGSGVLLSIAADPNAARPADLADKALAKSTWYLVESLGSNLAEITALVEAGALRPIIDSVWEFDEFAKAFERLEGGHARGKIVIKVDGLI